MTAGPGGASDHEAATGVSGAYGDSDFGTGTTTGAGADSGTGTGTGGGGGSVEGLRDGVLGEVRDTAADSASPDAGADAARVGNPDWAATAGAGGASDHQAAAEMSDACGGRECCTDSGTGTDSGTCTGAADDSGVVAAGDGGAAGDDGGAADGGVTAAGAGGGAPLARGDGGELVSGGGAVRGGGTAGPGDGVTAARGRGARDGAGTDPGGAGVSGPAAESPWRPTALTMSSPAEFIAAVPALLGFRPQRSLVACLLLKSQEYPGAVYLGAVARHDLDVVGCGVWVRLASQLAAICGHSDAVGVVMLIVDDRAGAPRPGRAGRRAARHRDLIRILDGALRAEDVLLAEAWAVADIAVGADWWSVPDAHIHGTQSDPEASPVALAQVLDGRPIRTSRTELTAAVAPDSTLCAEVDAVLADVAEAARDRLRRALRLGAPRSYSRAALEKVLCQIGTVDSGDQLEPRELAELAVAVRDTAVRDSLFAVALGDQAAAAEALWTRACRGLTGGDRAELATLAGYSAYTRGDGPLAGVALDAALHADPAHRIAQLLDAALRTGMRPEEVRKLAFSGSDTAAGLGLDLGVAGPHEPPTGGPR